jgi:hypothetical protein
VKAETPKQRLASLLLGQAVAPWIRARRPDTSWRLIAAELREKTQGEIDVPPQTLINWAPDPAPEPAERAEAAS